MSIKIIYLVTIALSLLFLGCGETSDEIKEKGKVIILHNVNLTGCTALEGYSSNKLKKDDRVKNVAFSNKNNDVSCASYNKTKGELSDYSKIDASIAIECAEIPFSELQAALPEKDLSIFESKDRSCVLSFDVI
jgi:hypothetical protein